MNRREVLESAIKCVCHDRQGQHGNPENTFAMIADLWEMYICHKYNVDFSLAPEDVCVMMSLFKAARFALGKHSDDHSVDGAGYFALANELRAESENRRSQSTYNERNLNDECSGLSDTEKAIRAFSR